MSNPSPDSIAKTVYLTKEVYPYYTEKVHHIPQQVLDDVFNAGLLPDIRIEGLADNGGPKIAVILEQDKHPDRAEKDLSLYPDYLQAVVEAGGQPYFLAHDKIKEQMDMIKPHGILLVGGDFELPVKGKPYTNHRGLAYLALIDYAKQHRLPVLGICAGMQMLASDFGASLITRINDDRPAEQSHRQGGEKIAHKTLIAQDSLLGSVLKTDAILTNSAHHDAVSPDDYGQNVISARAEDGVIEAIEPINAWHDFVLGVQWHPERFFKKGDQASIDIFKAFVAAANPKNNLVEITHPRFIVELMYADLKQNMTGRAVYQEMGFGNRAYVHKDLWEKLQKLIPWLEKNNRKMKVCDAYRPPLAHRKMREVIPQNGYFCSVPEKSLHCYGTAIDVCLTDENGVELKYPTLVDAYDAAYAKEVQAGQLEGFFKYLEQASHSYTGASAEQTANREELRSLMESVGLEIYDAEWWHYELPDGRGDKYSMIEW